MKVLHETGNHKVGWSRVDATPADTLRPSSRTATHLQSRSASSKGLEFLGSIFRSVGTADEEHERHASAHHNGPDSDALATLTGASPQIRSVERQPGAEARAVSRSKLDLPAALR